MIEQSTTKEISLRFCKECSAVIDETGLCSFQCSSDGELHRKPGTIILRTYRRVDTLIREKEI